MATEEDNFDIDIYGDGGEDYQQDAAEEDGAKIEDSPENLVSIRDAPQYSKEQASLTTINGQESHQDPKLENGAVETGDVAQKIASTDDSTQDAVHLPKQAPQTQGLKRKDGSDDRFVDSGATTALFISELHWWVTDDDVRGWANQSQCEDELEEITFSEHKVNGKSKGQAWVLFKSPQAATAAKQKIESFGEGQQYTKKFLVNFTSPYTNPFRTLPKDGPTRNSNPPNNNRTTPGGFGNTGVMSNMSPQSMGYHMNNTGGGFRGGRGGGYNNRGGGMNNMPGYNRGGFQQPMSGGFQGAQMGGYQGAPMGGMQSYGGFQNRGGMMGGMRGGAMNMRGGRGGMTPNGMIGMPMGNMGMGGMNAQMGGMGMGMPQIGAAMGMQGMQGSHNHPYANSARQHPSLANSIRPVYATIPPAGLYTSSAISAGQYSSSGHGKYPSSTMGGDFGNIHPPRGPNRASSSQSVSLAPSLPPAHFPSQPVASMTAVNPAFDEQSGSLNRTTSHAGPAGFPGAQPHYNPAFFPQSQQVQQNVGGGDSTWNPHGAKRTRQE